MAAFPTEDRLRQKRTKSEQAISLGVLIYACTLMVSLIGDRPELLRKGVGDVSWCE